MIKTMSEHHKDFVSKMRDCGLLHETNLRLPFFWLEASLYDGCGSFLPLKSNLVDDAPLTDLEEAFNPLLTSLSFVAPSFSSPPMDTSVSNLSLLVFPLTLA